MLAILHKKLPIAVHEVKEWMNAQGKLIEELEDQKPGYLGARLAKRMITDCYARGRPAVAQWNAPISYALQPLGSHPPSNGGILTMGSKAAMHRVPLYGFLPCRILRCVFCFFHIP